MNPLNSPDSNPWAVSLASSRPARRCNTLVLHAPFVGIESARLALRCDEKHLFSAIASGDLEWAFDLRTLGASRAYVRILTDSIVRYRRWRIIHRKRQKPSRHTTDSTLDDILDSVFRHSKPGLLSTELVRVWGCSSNHLRRLVQAGLLAVVRKGATPNDASVISRSSVARFMCERRMC